MSMVSINDVPAEMWDLPAPIIIGCESEVAERLVGLVCVWYMCLCFLLEDEDEPDLWL